MPFPYYDNLSAAGKRIYRKSDALQSVPLRHSERIHPVTIKLKESLEESRGRDVAKHASELCRLVCQDLGIEALAVKIRTRRPSSSGEELQGLYERAEGEKCVLTVWMKTAVKGRVVAFKSFIRTVLHELCHHLDYAYFNLEDSFHTEGFFKREASLYRQIVPAGFRCKAPAKSKVSPGKIREREADGPEQMRLFR
jgi:hypothetical protein